MSDKKLKYELCPLCSIGNVQGYDNDETKQLDLCCDSCGAYWSYNAERHEEMHNEVKSESFLP